MEYNKIKMKYLNKYLALRSVRENFILHFSRLVARGFHSPQYNKSPDHTARR